jgi:hypothetical protein
MKKDILRLRAAIRWHRDQKGDDRCWLDDFRVWACVEGSPAQPLRVPDDAMAQCRAFFLHRNAAAPDIPPPDAGVPGDDDIDDMTPAHLAAELARVQAAVRAHRDIARPRTAGDDRALYAVLPEKIPADFRLPPEGEFLGEARAPHAGCPSFWRSHGACAGAHDFSRWGPCE